MGVGEQLFSPSNKMGRDPVALHLHCWRGTAARLSFLSTDHPSYHYMWMADH